MYLTRGEKVGEGEVHEQRKRHKKKMCKKEERQEIDSKRKGMECEGGSEDSEYVYFTSVF